MIVEGLLNAILSLLQVIFGWINLPSFPADIENTLWSFEELMFSSATCLGFFVRLSTVFALLPLLLIIVNFDQVYRLVMWIVRKIPFLNMS